ncbi:hypothetical protein E4O05_07390 [Treponema sp. OMZ 787]|uniref:hypothetical protein n=1 Tax=Treponema sp. OMZ 787 TaxID=2563669 RepID=UPI0020A488B8|nr:hypothetical protein [Treponema sp. OMZ 787]UTC61386.1 hypothetical protein E4O05_07390 [Treponema sp. OMZ 787]
MINNIKKKWLFFLSFGMALIVTSWLLYTSISDLYKFNREVKLILKQNKRVEAVVIESYYIRRDPVTYWFRTEHGRKYYAKLLPSFKNPDIGEKLVILS